jgi:hypothetical protein
MKKLVLILFAALALAACEETIPDPEEPTGASWSSIVYNFTVKFPVVPRDPDDPYVPDELDETEMFKSGWEPGDAVFLFFQGYTGFYVRLTYNGSEWASEIGPESASMPMTFSPEEKFLTAIYRPFGSYDTASCGAGGWTFSQTQYSYFLYAEKVPYTLEMVSGRWVLSATLNMVYPAGCLQFWMEDAEASNELCNLAVDAVIPTGFASVTLDGSVVEISGKSAGDAMPGYKYDGGYLFSGRLNPLSAGTAFYLIKSDYWYNDRQDYLITGMTPATRRFIRLPANGSSEWIQVGENKYVELKDAENNSLGIWSTCNFGATLPEQFGDELPFVEAVKHPIATADQFLALLDNCEWVRLRLRDTPGYGVKAASGCLFLPAAGYAGRYWTSSAAEDDKAWHLSLPMADFDVTAPCLALWLRGSNLCVRPIQE